MNWRWKHVLPVEEVCRLIEKLDHAKKKKIYGEWGALTAGARRNSGGLYSQDVSGYMAKVHSRLPISPKALNDFIMAKALSFNQARAHIKDVFICPHGCSDHRVSMDHWEVLHKDDGTDLFISGRNVTLRRGSRSHQVIPSDALSVDDYVLRVSPTNNNDFELPGGSPDIYRASAVSDVNSDRFVLVNLLTNIEANAEGMMFVRMRVTDALSTVENIRDHLDSLHRNANVPYAPSPNRLAPSIGGGRIIDLGGL